MSPGLRLHRPGGRTLTVEPGPRLLAHLDAGPGLVPHRRLYGDLEDVALDDLLDAAHAADLRGRGGAGFPLARKLETAAAAPGRPTVVVNLSEGEPASAKDAALALAAPHLVLDGASVTARALGAREVHVVVPAEHGDVAAAVRRALPERARDRHSRPGRHSRRDRRDRRLRWRLHQAGAGFVSGQARAVIELLSGRPNLPVTAWQPEAQRGLRGRPTLLSNAETFAQVAVLARIGGAGYATLGTVAEPGSCLLTVDGDTRHGRVVEVGYGTPWPEVLGRAVGGPVLLGGYHGTWAGPGALARLTVSRAGLAQHGLALGAGVVLPLSGRDCPVTVSTRITGYLAGQSAGRCGPCLNGLPALATAMRAVHDGTGPVERVRELAGLVTGRGACAHPDGTARLVASLLAAYPGEVAEHEAGGCGFGREQRRAG